MAPAQKRALIACITGQGGLYLAELLLGKGYQVFGLIRGQNNPEWEMVGQFLPAVELLEGDLGDTASLVEAVNCCQPDEVYSLAAIPFVAFSFKKPERIGNITGLGALRLLDAIRIVDEGKGRIRYYQAATSELFGKVRETPQTELTPFHPRSPYGVAEGDAYHSTVNYRESHNLLATGETHSNQEFLDLAFAAAGIEDWRLYVKQDPRLARPAEVDLLHGDPTGAKVLGWEPEVSFPELGEMMVENDLQIERTRVPRQFAPSTRLVR